MKLITAENKLLLKSFGPLIVGIFLLIFLSRIVIDKINTTNQSLKSLKDQKEILSQKLNIIKNISEDTLTGASLATIALPGGNAGISASSQVKKFAFENNLILTSLKTGVEISDKSGVKKSELKFDVLGPIDSIYGLISDIENMLPVVRIAKIEVSGDGLSTRASITLTTYWAEMPKKLPEITEKTSQLTTEDMKLIDELGLFTQPDFIDIPPSEDNQNPAIFGN